MTISIALIPHANYYTRIWDTTTGQMLFMFPRARLANLSQDETTLWTINVWRTVAHTHSSVELWDLHNDQKLFTIGDAMRGISSQDKTKFLVINEDHTAYIWDSVIGRTDSVCQLVPRNFTTSEWSQYMAGPYRPTCPTVPIPADVIEGIQAESQALIRQGEVSRATQRLAQLNGWLQANGQFATYGVDVAAFVAQATATPSPTVAPRAEQTATPAQALSPLRAPQTSPLPTPTPP